MLRSNPSENGSLLYNKPEISARFLSEVLLVYSCARKEVQVRNTIGKCYEELPMTYLNNTNAYMQPLSRIIVYKANEIDCEQIFHNQFKLDNI